MQTFTVNEFLSLKLNGRQTEIYVNNEHKHFCKHLIIAIPIAETEDWDGYKSMDEIIAASRKISHKYNNNGAANPTAEEEFWGHCSNIQAWADNGYHYTLLHTQLSIPIILDILKGLVKDRDRLRFRKFFHNIVKSLDDYTKNSRQTIETYNGDVIPNPALYSKFKFLKAIIFRERDKYFTDEEISGSVILSDLYNNNREAYLIAKEKKRFSSNLSRWERKLYPRMPVVEANGGYYVGDKYFDFEHEAETYAKNQNLKYRRFLRNIRNACDEGSRFYITKSHRSGYLPYLYAKGQFTNEKNISFLEIDGTLYIRDSDGKYWREERNTQWEEDLENAYERIDRRNL